VVNNWCKTFFSGFMVELLRPGIAKVGQVARRLDHRHLHA
jgi:hypothetical protein